MTIFFDEFDEFFWQISSTNLWVIFFSTNFEESLTIASFRIGGPTILFFIDFVKMEGKRNFCILWQIWYPIKELTIIPSILHIPWCYLSINPITTLIEQTKNRAHPDSAQRSNSVEFLGCTKLTKTTIHFEVLRFAKLLYYKNDYTIF